MNKLLATTAVALVAFAGAASAQSVLERVLGQIDNATNLASVNGTFANIAENIGGAGSVTVYNDPTVAGVIITQAEFDAAAIAVYQSSYVGIAVGDYVDPSAGTTITAAEYGALSAADQAAFQAVANVGDFLVDVSGSVISRGQHSLLVVSNPYSAFVPTVVAVAGLAGVNGSINNVIDGITEATQTATAGVVNAIEFNMPTLNFGNMATTALGAVNTGDITLGVNSAVDEAKTTSTQAVSSVMNQLGGSADTGAIVLNIASNMTGINGSINNAMTEVNGTIGNLSTTALGAVNTGVIISGVNAAVNGIVGQSGQSGL
jgi:hypothetical protein